MYYSQRRKILIALKQIRKGQKPRTSKRPSPNKLGSCSRHLEEMKKFFFFAKSVTTFIIEDMSRNSGTTEKTSRRPASTALQV